MPTGGKLAPVEIDEMASSDEMRTLLIVDDEERLRRALGRSLGQGNWQTQTAASGEEALGVLKRKDVDLVITDLVMPGMDGMSLAREIKSSQPGTEVIILTAYGSPESMEEAEALGVGCYLAKPFDLAYLKSKISELLGPLKASASSSNEVLLRVGPRRLRVICSAGGRTAAVAVALPRQALQYIRPRNVMLAAGKLAGTLSGLRFRFSGLASVFKKAR